MTKSRRPSRCRTPSATIEASSGRMTASARTTLTARPRRSNVSAIRRSSRSSSTRSSPLRSCCRRASASRNRVSPNEMTIAVSESACGSGLDDSAGVVRSASGGSPAGPPAVSKARTAAWPSTAKPSTIRLSTREVARYTPTAVRQPTTTISDALTTPAPGRRGGRADRGRRSRAARRLRGRRARRR